MVTIFPSKNLKDFNEEIQLKYIMQYIFIQPKLTRLKADNSANGYPVHAQVQQSKLAKCPWTLRDEFRFVTSLLPNLSLADALYFVLPLSLKLSSSKLYQQLSEPQLVGGDYACTVTGRDPSPSHVYEVKELLSTPFAQFFFVF